MKGLVFCHDMYFPCPDCKEGGEGIKVYAINSENSNLLQKDSLWALADLDIMYDEDGEHKFHYISGRIYVCSLGKNIEQCETLREKALYMSKYTLKDKIGRLKRDDNGKPIYVPVYYIVTRQEKLEEFIQELEKEAEKRGIDEEEHGQYRINLLASVTPVKEVHPEWYVYPKDPEDRRTKRSQD